MTAGILLYDLLAKGQTICVFVCGTSQFTLALYTDLTQRTLESNFTHPATASANL